MKPFQILISLMIMAITSYGEAQPRHDICTSGSETFDFTGADQHFHVPKGCTQIIVKAWGAGGGGFIGGQAGLKVGNLYLAGSGGSGYAGGPGAIVESGVGSKPGNQNDPDLGKAGRGGQHGSSGTNGRIVISW